MNILFRAYRDQYFTFRCAQDYDTQHAYMLQFCEVDNWNYSGMWWADLDNDASLVFRKGFSYSRKGYGAKQPYIVANLLAAENGCMVNITVKCNLMAWLPVNIVFVVIGLLLLFVTLANWELSRDALPLALFILIVIPLVVALNFTRDKKYLVKKFVEQFDLIKT